MPCTIQNKEGKFLSIGFQMDIEDVEVNELEEWAGQNKVEQVKELCQIVRGLSSYPKFAKGGVRQEIGVYYRWSCQGGFCNESEIIECDEESVKKEMNSLARWYEKLTPRLWLDLKTMGWDRKIPGQKNIKKGIQEWTVKNYTVESAANAAISWGIWIESEDREGWMDVEWKFHHEGAIRCFYSWSAANAAVKVKQNQIKKKNNEEKVKGIAILKLHLEVEEIITIEGASTKLKEVMTGKEKKEFKRILSGAARPVEIKSKHEQERVGWWIGNGKDGNEGFLNARDQIGGLAGAYLEAMKSDSKVYYRNLTRVKVRIVPLKMEGIWGEIKKDWEGGVIIVDGDQECEGKKSEKDEEESLDNKESKKVKRL